MHEIKTKKTEHNHPEIIKYDLSETKVKHSQATKK